MDFEKREAFLLHSIFCFYARFEIEIAGFF